MGPRAEGFDTGATTWLIPSDFESPSTDCYIALEDYFLVSLRDVSGPFTIEETVSVRNDTWRGAGGGMAICSRASSHDGLIIGAEGTHLNVNMFDLRGRGVPSRTYPGTDVAPGAKSAAGRYIIPAVRVSGSAVDRR